jgi:hypothetical protein
MAGLLDFLMQGQGGGGLLGGGMSLPDAFGGNQGMVTAGLGLASGMTPGEGFRNMMPALQQAYEQQQGQRAGMALLSALPSGQQPQAAPQAPPMAAPGMSPISNFGNAIAGIESKGQANPYAALGPVTKSGDQAYGKYQVMGANIPSWTKEHLGQEMTPLQFLSDPQAQEAVFKGQFGKYVQQTGNPQDAASMWFTGQPLAQGANRADVNGMTGQRYVNQFTQNLGPQGAPQGAPVQTAQAGPPVAPQATAAPPQAPQGQAMAGSGLTLLDSPALQGMPDTVRRAIPAMLASKQYAPQAMALMQKYINPEQWQMYRDAQGNVITRNTATGESKPLISATPDMMNAAASGMKTPFQYQAATQLSGSAAKNTEVTPEQKNAAASGGMSPLQFDTAKAQEAKLGEMWVKKYETATEAGVNAYKQLPQLALVKQIVTNDPNFYSGIGQDYNLALKKIGVAIGLDPNMAASQEIVGKVLSDQIATGLRTAFGGLGQVRVAELNVLQQSLASKGNSPEALKALVTIAEKTQRRAADIAEIAQNYDNGSGRLNAGYDRAVTEYDKSHPFLTPDEIANYKKIADSNAGPAASKTPAPNPYEAEMRRRGLLK